MRSRPRVAGVSPPKRAATAATAALCVDHTQDDLRDFQDVRKGVTRWLRRAAERLCRLGLESPCRQHGHQFLSAFVRHGTSERSSLSAASMGCSSSADAACIVDLCCWTRPAFSQRKLARLWNQPFLFLPSFPPTEMSVPSRQAAVSSSALPEARVPLASADALASDVEIVEEGRADGSAPRRGSPCGALSTALHVRPEPTFHPSRCSRRRSPFASACTKGCCC